MLAYQTMYDINLYNTYPENKPGSFTLFGKDWVIVRPSWAGGLKSAEVSGVCGQPLSSQTDQAECPATPPSRPSVHLMLTPTNGMNLVEFQNMPPPSHHVESVEPNPE